MTSTSTPSEEVVHSPGPSLARSATLLSLGNVVSRVLGLVRESVIAAYFGASGEISAFRIAAQAPVLLYDFLVGGMLSAALVPVLSDHARRDHADFIRLVSVIVACTTVGLTALTLVLEWAAPSLAWLLAAGFRTEHPELLGLTERLLRSSLPITLILSLVGVVTAALYSLQRFTFPALATAVFNLGIIVAAPLLAARVGVFSLVWGLLAGSLAQLMLTWWDLRRAAIPIRIVLDWRHPALSKVLRLYAPIAIGLVVSLMQVGLDRRLASGAGPQSIAWMANATTLQQMPLGLISVAIALAALPQLSQHFATQQEEGYRQTLGRGLRMVLVLMMPAAIGLWLLGEPLTRLLFERGQFTSVDTSAVVQALNIYVLGMLFAAVDFPLNYAFYARNNTFLPALVGVLSVGVYVIVALLLVAPLGYLGLVWADTAKQASHALMMTVLLYQRLGRLQAGVSRGLAVVLTGAAGMSLALWSIRQLAGAHGTHSFLGDLLLVSGGGGLGLAVYVAILASLRFPELQFLFTNIRARAMACSEHQSMPPV